MTTEIYLYRGDSQRVIVRVLDHEGEPVDVSGGERIRWWAARGVRNPPVIQKDTDDGTTTRTADNTFFFWLLPADTADLGSGFYYHEAELIMEPDRVYTALSGKLRILPTLID